MSKKISTNQKTSQRRRKHNKITSSSLPNWVLTGLCALVIMLYFTPGSLLAHDDHPDKDLPAHEQPHPDGGQSNLAGAATNPIGNLVQFQMQNSFSPSNYNADGYSNVAVVQPVIPINLPWKKVPMLITRTTIPYIITPDLDGIGRKDGFGDITAQGWVLPKLKAKGQMIGLGYNLTIPTGGDNDFIGSGKWSIGPNLVYFNMTIPSLQWGVLTYSSSSFASANSDGASVSNVAIEPILYKHFDKGWYVGLPDVPQTYDFMTQNWTLAIGPRVGRVMKFGKQPVNLFGQVTWNPLDNDDQVSSEWTFKLNLTLLFPK
jgi:hypothetical protein